MEPQVTAAVVEEAPPGYRWVSRRWKTLPDGTCDYAIYHGQEALRELVPVSSKAPAANPYPLLVPELEPGRALEREPQLEPAYAVVREPPFTAAPAHLASRTSLIHHHRGCCRGHCARRGHRPT
ncbi:MAG: hypothetical protein ACXW20_11785 [Burkholderiales bacterium]